MRGFQPKTGFAMIQRHCGFTLIELLVAITIIVVLLAMLAPALDKAVYHAELVQCAAKQDTIIGSGFLYAMDFKRYYPTPPGGRYTTGKPDLLYRGDEDPTRQRLNDLRTVLPGYIDLSLLLCPLAGKINLTWEANDDTTRVHSSYWIWFGWGYAASNTRMSKMGSRASVADPVAGTTYNFRLLVSDNNQVQLAGTGNRSSHPEQGNNRMELVVEQNDPKAATADLVVTQIGGYKSTGSHWSKERRLLDLNFGFDDGSVITYYGLEKRDDRLKRAPASGGMQAEGWHAWLPL